MSFRVPAGIYKKITTSMKTTMEEKQTMNASEFKQFLINRLADINQKLQAMLDSQAAEAENNSKEGFYIAIYTTQK